MRFVKRFALQEETCLIFSINHFRNKMHKARQSGTKMTLEEWYDIKEYRETTRQQVVQQSACCNFFKLILNVVSLRYLDSHQKHDEDKV